MKQLTFLLLFTFLYFAGSTSAQQLNSDQLQKKNNLRQASMVVSELMKNPAAKAVVLAGIRLGYYPDESVKFSDLMNPSSSPVYRSNPYLGETPATSFATAFQSKLQNGQYLFSSDYTGVNNLVAYLTQNDIQIYFPYSDNFPGDVNPLVTFDPILEVDQNDGYMLNTDGSTYTMLTVTDAVAQVRPVFIINTYEGGVVGQGETDSGGTGTVEPRSGPGEDCNIPPLRMSVQIKELKFMSQWDNIFQGGPEFVFVRGAFGYNAAGTQVVTTAPQVRIAMKRSWKGGWRGVNTLWDQRWEFDEGQFEELEQFFAVYEDDNNSSTTVTLGGSLKANIKLPKIGGVETALTGNVSHTISSADDVVYNQQLDRCYLINTNPTNQGLGTWQNLCVRGVGGADAVYWTLQLIPW